MYRNKNYGTKCSEEKKYFKLLEVIKPILFDFPLKCFRAYNPESIHLNWTMQPKNY